MNELFRKTAQRIARIAGTFQIFFLAVATIIIWAILGPFLGYSNTWQLSINTMTTVITFLMVFLIQNTQNRDSKAMHLKLDELLRAVKGTRPLLLDTDRLSDEEFEHLHEQFVKISEKYENALKHRRKNKEARGLRTPEFK